MKTLASTLGLFFAFHACLAQISTKPIVPSNAPDGITSTGKFWKDGFSALPENAETKTSGEAESLAKCDDFSTLVCGQTYTNQSLNQSDGNDFTISDYNCISSSEPFSGYDRLYKVTVSQKSSVHFVLDILNNADFDMFLLTSCSPANCYAFSIGFNQNTGISREVLDVNLNPGTYYLVVDAYNTSQSGSFNLSMNCSCTCVEAANDQPFGHKIFCDGFEDYLSGEYLTPQGTRWLLWDRCADPNFGCNSNLSDDANVIDENGNKLIRILDSATIQPDLVYMLDNQTSGRWRISWKMRVAPDKGGYYNLLHTLANADGANANWACEVFFNPGGSGDLEVANNQIATFNYPVNKWFTVVNVIDQAKDSIQLWINGNFVRQWKFSLSSSSNLNRLAGANFYAASGSDYFIDDICFWGQLSPCYYPANYDPICIENGSVLTNQSHARCELYTSEEWGICNTVCDYGGTFIYRGESYTDSLDLSDKAPSQILNAPCIKSAYGGNVPGNLAADIYIYYQDPNDVSGNQIDIDFDNKGVNSTKCFVFVCSRQAAQFNGNQSENACESGQFCWLNSDIGSGVTDITLNSCSNFYYLVVTGLPGACYSNLTITPSGKCPSNPTPIACGETKNESVFQFDPYFSVDGDPQDGSAYQQCYTGSRAYNGGENFYKFTLSQQTTVKLSMSSTNQMGMFLYSFVCGSSCIAYAENTASNSQAIINQSLPEGSYYIIIDKDGGATNDFTLSLTCNAQNNFLITLDTDDGVVCPTDPTQLHQVAIPQNAYAFDANDLIYFLYRDDSGLLTSNDSLNKYWPGLPTLFFNIKGDLGNDTTKCSYTPNDTFFVHILQTEPGKRTHQKMIATFAPPGPGITGGSIFKPDSISLIAQLQPDGRAVTFGASTGLVRLKPDIVSASFIFSASRQWTVEKQSTADWLTVTPTSSDGAEEIKLDLQLNTSNVPRSTVLLFRSTDDPDLYRQFVKVEQLGNCTTPSVSITPNSPVNVCVGQPVTLSANTGSQPEELFEFQWSTGDSTQSMMPPTTLNGTFSYTVTVTNRDCFTTATANKSVTINAVPAAPGNPQNQIICADAPVPPLSVSVPGGVTVDWYNQATGSQPIQTGNPSYTPPPVSMTYYAEARNTTTGCFSANRTPVTLTVNPVPTIQILDTLCAPNNMSYDVVLTTTNGATVTATAGLVSGGNGNFNIVNVPAGEPIDITATLLSTGCFKTISLPAPTCGCPPVSPPISSNPMVNICEGAPIPTLSVTVGPNQTADWYDVDENLLLENSTSYSPADAGVFQVKARDLTNGCVSAAFTLITVTINPLPTLVFSDTLCAPNLSTYSLEITTNGDEVLSSAGTVSGSGTVTISGIPTGTNPLVTARNTNTGCEQQQSFDSPVCACPSIAAPVVAGPFAYCQGAPIPNISVSVGANETVDWYAAATGGQPLAGGQGTTTFTPPQAGTYYAEAHNLVNGCTSLQRSPVILNENPKPVLTVLKDTCEITLIYYRVIVSTDGNSVTAPPYTVLNDGGGVYSVIGIPTGTEVTIKANFTATGCSRQVMVKKEECLCPQLAAPISNGDKTICAGDDFPYLTVHVNPGETADWFDEFDALLLTGDTAYLPTAAGTYFAQTRQLANGCPSSTKTEVKLTINTPATANAGNDTIICDNGLVTLNGLVAGVTGASWSASVPGGVFGNPNALNTSYTPPSGFNTILLTLTTDDPSGPCPAVSDQLMVNVNPLPGIQIVDTICAPDLQSYSVQFSSMNTQISISPNIGTLFFLGNDQYLLDAVPNGSNVTITATSSITGCARILTVPAPKCDCAPLAAPISLGDTSACPGVAVLPPLKVDPGPGNTTDWYENATGGTVLPAGMGTNSFIPSGANIYYAEARNLATGCTSGSRTEVKFSYLMPPTANAGPDQSVCPGDGLVLTAALGPQYTFLWNTGTTGNTLTVNPAQPPGYSVTVTAANGCTAADTVAVSFRPTPTVSIAAILPIPCFGTATGALSAGAQGGSGSGYTVVWSNGQTTAQILNLPAGIYTVTLTDSAGCKDTTVYTLTEPPALALVDSMIVHVPSPSSPTGSISVTVSGGTPPYSYQWISNGSTSPGDTSSVILNKLPGMYQVQVTDANGCTFTSMILVILVPTKEPDWSPFIQAYPNPTEGLVRIAFNLPEHADTEIIIYDAIGRLIQTRATEHLKEGILTVDMADRPDGIYLFRINLDRTRIVTKTIILNK